MKVKIEMLKKINLNTMSAIKLSFALVLFSLLFFINGTNVYAATKTWAGTNSNAAWSLGSNWSPAGAPVDGDDIVFNCSLIAECSSVYDTPGFTANSVSFQGSVAGSVINLTQAPMYITGDITSTNPGTIFHASLILNTDISTNNTLLGAVDLNGHSLTMTGKGINDNSSNGCVTGSCIGVMQELSGDGVLNINVDADQEFMLVGNNTYSGITNVNSGKFVSNGQNTTNHTIDMFGVSDINVGPLGKVVFTFDETENGYSFDNKISFSGGSTNYSQMDLINQSTNNSLISIGLTDVHLQSDARFDANTTEGGLTINLLGIVSNNHCLTYGSNNSQSSSFINGPDCTDDETPTTPPSSVTSVPGTPNTGKKSSTIMTTILGMIALTGLSFGAYIKRLKLK